MSCGGEACACRRAGHRRRARQEGLALLLPSKVVRRAGEQLDRDGVARGLVLERPSHADAVIGLPARVVRTGAATPVLAPLSTRIPPGVVAEDRVLADQVARPLGDLDRIDSRYRR